jgi:hypothetical protein
VGTDLDGLVKQLFGEQQAREGSNVQGRQQQNQLTQHKPRQ